MNGVVLYQIHVVRCHYLSHAECGCGMTGNPHWLTGVAKVDAWQHAYETGHEPGIPLVVSEAR